MSYNQDNFWPGFLVGLCCAIFSTLLVINLGPIVVPVDKVIVYDLLRNHKVQIVLNDRAEFWLWSEQTKTSIKVSYSDMTRIANNLGSK